MLEQVVVQQVPAPRAPLCTPAAQLESQHRRPLWSVIMGCNGFLEKEKGFRKAS